MKLYKQSLLSRRTGLSLAAFFVASAAALGSAVVVGCAASDSARASTPNTADADLPGMAAGAWSSDPIWYDGLVEQATYDAQMTLYGRPRSFEAVVLTNKEQHDLSTRTKADGSTDTVEVWKHNYIEVAPTPNYDYKFVTTSHFAVDDLTLTRFDFSSQEWCGTSFKQYQRAGDGWDYWSFSYMPEAGRVSGQVSAGDAPTVPLNGLSLFLRGYDFDAREPLDLWVLPDQKMNRPSEYKPVHATVRFIEETSDGYQLSVDTSPSEPGSMSTQVNLGTFVFAKDRQHVMLSATFGNGDSYELKSLDRVDYWTRDED